MATTTTAHIVLRELLRLYDWRLELGKLERDLSHDRGAMKRDLLRYGREKKAAWDLARKVLEESDASQN